MIDISFPVAFVGGVISFFAPCVVPLLPAYIAYVTGISLPELKEHGVGPYQRTLIFSSLFYILGFSLIFTILGTAAAGLGGVFREYQLWLQVLGGGLIILFGLQFAGFLQIPLLSRTFSFSAPPWVSKLGVLRPFFLGVLFAIVWTPCVGVVLGSILTLAAIKGEALVGASLLFVYSLGISLPFLIVAGTLAQAPKYISAIVRYERIVSKIVGLLLVIIGVLLVTDTYKFLNAWIFELAFRLGYQIR